jgi:hypothetical protein
MNLSCLHSSTPRFGAVLLARVPLQYVHGDHSEIVPGQVWQVEDEDKETLIKSLNSWSKSGQSTFSNSFIRVGEGRLIPGALHKPMDLLMKKKWISKVLGSAFLQSHVPHINPMDWHLLNQLKGYSLKGLQILQAAQAYRNAQMFVMTVGGKMIGITYITSTLDAHNIAYMETAYWNRRSSDKILGKPHFHGVLEGLLYGAFKSLGAKKIEWFPANSRVRKRFDNLIKEKIDKRPHLNWILIGKRLSGHNVQKLIEVIELENQSKTIPPTLSEQVQETFSKINEPITFVEKDTESQQVELKPEVA